MSDTPSRLAQGGRIDRGTPLSFQLERNTATNEVGPSRPAREPDR